ncbi:hypothetical protein AMAG_15878 [Allomyces macrogynus ATCC 38327]|uniref:Uncharacterized protein n=1 Tax=Allomyces macrogynus (strain ATCC 38327) TaxID=578462 RepID=A0A0L0T8T5_ALLM3|nr:hypothetical protein AMAG_15878 [Allomyces macrogynus ATCC 38327]|eukprot:KNE71223.1 hypothetical protein AMAG_15878 [Allomyces macrogynus ATCC 38327]
MSLHTKFFGHLPSASSTGQFGMSDHLLAESYLADASMYHVNGLVDHGQLAVDATQRVLACYDLPARFVFHLELFDVGLDHAPQLDNKPVRGTKPYFALCEIAGWHPNTSVPNLIARLIGTSFTQLEFRFNAGLEYVVPRIAMGPRIGDLFIPLRDNCTVVTMPALKMFPFAKMKYVPLARRGLVYLMYGGATPYMAAWMLAPRGSSTSIVQKLLDAARWFARHIVCAPLDDAKALQARR